MISFNGAVTGMLRPDLDQGEIERAMARLAAARTTPAADANAVARSWMSFTNPVPPPTLPNARLAAIDPQHGKETVSSIDELLALSRRGSTPGANGIQSVKFLMVDAGTSDEQTFLINGATHPYHYFFYRGAGLGTETNDQFTRDTYVFFDRDPPLPHTNLAGTLSYYPNHKDEAGNAKPLLTFGFWPTDHVQAEDINRMYEGLKASLDFDGVDLAYLPAGETQERLLERYRGDIDPAIAIEKREDLFAHVDFKSVNPGVSYGYLTDRDLNALGPRDIAIFPSNAPNDGLPHLRGFITGEPQTDGSHIALLAEQDGIPNAMIRDPISNPELAPFINSDRPVRFEVTEDGFSVREATQLEVDEHFEAIRPLEPTTLERNLDKREVLGFEDPNFGLKDADAYGGKAAALAELWNVSALDNIPNVQRMKGYGLPFFYYQEFMTTAVVPGDGRTFDEYAQDMLADPDFQADPNVRRERLEQFQEWIEDTPLPAHLEPEIDRVWASRTEFARDPQARPEDVNVRARSSGAGEDSAGWSGAGIYTSYTNNQREDLKDTVRQTWASWWNFEAVEERGFYKFEHLSGAMGVGLHQNFPDDDEVATGVAFTKSDAFPGWRGHYVHAQVGGGSVTNPDPGERHDSFLMADLGGQGLELLYSSRSNRTQNGESVLSPKMVTALNDALTAIHEHWAKLFDREGDETFGVDVEWKVEGEGDDETLVIKQVRPLVDPPGNPAEDTRREFVTFAEGITGGQPLGADHAAQFVDRVREEFAALSPPYPRNAPNPKTAQFGIKSALGEIEQDASAAPVLDALLAALPRFAAGANVKTDDQDVRAVLSGAAFDGLDEGALLLAARRGLERDANFGTLERFLITGYSPAVGDSPGRVDFLGSDRKDDFTRSYLIDASGSYRPL